MAEARIEIDGNRLKRERESHKWTQKELAEKINGAPRTIRRWEKEGAMLHPDMLARFTQAFGKPPEEWGNANPRWSNMPFPRNRYFTGRERILQSLHDALRTERNVALNLAISGLGGIGKTSTVLEYAHRYAEEYEAVLWVRADTETLDADFANLAAVLELPEREERDQSRAVKAVTHWLQHHNSWLLIFDNANDLKRVFDYLPGQRKGAVLLTTRLQATGSYVDVIDIDKMTRKEGITFLLRRKYAHKTHQLPSADLQERVEAGKLYDALGGLPLALDQAAAYLEETGCTFSDYLGLFETNRRELMKRRGEIASEHPESVAATWLVTLKKIERDRPAAAQLLRFCAFLQPDAIPEFLFIKGADALWPALQRTAADSFAWNGAIAELRKYSLVKRNDQKKTLTMHRLLQAVIKDDMPPKIVRDWAERVVRAVCAAFPEPEPATWPQCESLRPHVSLVAGHIETYQFIREETGDLLYRMASYLHTRARYEEAETFYQKALQVREQRFGPNHPDVVTTLNSLGVLYDDQGRYAEAEPLHERVLRIREQQLGPEHPDVAMSINNLAAIYHQQGFYDKAAVYYQSALHIREQQLGLDHPDVATVLNNLAILYDEQGKYDKAKILYERAISIRELRQGPEHIDMAAPINNLAEIHKVQGQYAEAEELFLRAVRIMEKQLGSEHPNMAAALNSLASLYAVQGRDEEAETLNKQALRIQELRLGLDHPDMAYVLNDLANLFVARGKYEEAEAHFERALHIREHRLDPEHPLLGETLHDFAVFEELRGNLQEARSLYQRTLTIREHTFGTRHSKTMKTRSNLIALLRRLGLHEEAARLEAAQSEPEAMEP